MVIMTGARKHSSVSIAAAKYGYLRNAVNTNRLSPRIQGGD
jgi:hypothetical protein